MGTSTAQPRVAEAPATLPAEPPGQGPVRCAASAPTATPASTSAPVPALEPLACVACRSKKLRCGREIGACARCLRLKAECVYPESRRKVTSRRRNAQELEARLAHVEDMLKDTTRNKGLTDGQASHNEGLQTATSAGPIISEGPEEDGDAARGASQGIGEFDFDLDPFTTFGGNTNPDGGLGVDHDVFGTQLMGLGMFESMPPFEIIEALHNLYFQRQLEFAPIIHPARYLQAFHSSPHMRLPMCLQYAVWAVAASEHREYSSYRDVFYRRARQYLDADEMRGIGEQFISVAHAQAWILVAVYEARNLLFTRAAMSSARAVQLCHMMGLNRLDDPTGGIHTMPTLLPPQSWVELEERRRTFWGAFTLNSHATVSTGWPSLIDSDLITTNLPSSEEAFALGREVKTGKLSDLFMGSSYSPFAGTLGVCHIFNKLLRHVNRSRANDGADNVEYGAFWKRHREIDNLLLSAFMSLPDRFLRFSDLASSKVNTEINLNLHASVICLHMAAVDRADTYGLAPDLKRTSHARLLMSAHEIVKITRATSTAATAHLNPLIALSLYCAAVTYILLIKEGPGDELDGQLPDCSQNLDYIVARIEAVSKIHPITRSFLLQLIGDLKHHGLRPPASAALLDQQLPALSHNIPLLARTSISRHLEMGSPLPGYLPLGKPVGEASKWPNITFNCHNMAGFVEDAEESPTNNTTATANAAAYTTFPPPVPSDSAAPVSSPSEAGRSKRRRVGELEDPPRATAAVSLPHRSGGLATTPSSSGTPGSGIVVVEAVGGGGATMVTTASVADSTQSADSMLEMMGLGDAPGNRDAARDLAGAGVAWGEADMDALVQEFVEVNGPSGPLASSLPPDTETDEQVPVNGSHPWGGFFM